MVVLMTIQTAVSLRFSESLFGQLAVQRIIEIAQSRKSNVDMGSTGLKPG